MTASVAAPAAAPPLKRKVLVRRHGLLVRVTHWINALCLVFMLLSGLQIFNAHPALYWGPDARFDRPWVSMTAEENGARLKGVTQIGSARFDTTGILGASKVGGEDTPRALPTWLTLPASQNLALGRRWHFFWAWVFALNVTLYLVSSLINGHLRRDLAPTGQQLKPSHILREIVDHARLRFPRGEEARRYNVLQKGAYLGVAVLLLPLMILTGMTMSPSLDAAFPWLLTLFGGRQSARSIHFIVANLIVLFFLVHIVMVVLSGLWNNIRSMITGRYAIDVEEAAPVDPAPAAEAPSHDPPPERPAQPETEPSAPMPQGDPA
ncbi:MAG: cytochrome b/b6 domain-containing protein [Caulobacterales bacterium]